jgi:hypothetical protein
MSEGCYSNGHDSPQSLSAILCRCVVSKYESSAQLHTIQAWTLSEYVVECVWNVMAHAHNPYFVFRRNGRVHWNRWRRQFSRLLASEVCVSAVVILDTPCSEVVWRVLATHSIRQFPLHFPSLLSPCAITFQLDSSLLSHICFTLHAAWLRPIHTHGMPCR